MIRNHQDELEKDPINITYGILGQIFRLLDEEDISAIPCLTTLSKKRLCYCEHFFKTPQFYEKKPKNTLKKPA